MKLTRYQRLAYRLLGPSLEGSSTGRHLRSSLQKAHIQMRPEVYLSYTYLNMILVFAAGMLGLGVMFALSYLGVLAVPGFLFAVLIPLPLAVAFGTYLFAYLIPDLKAANRARDIDAKLPYALNYMATMSAGGVTPRSLFRSLSQQPLYGEVSQEAALISRDLNVLGEDLLTALANGLERTPSMKLQDLLQGAITAVSSGGDLKVYLQAKAEQFTSENRQDQKHFLESLGVLAESYVTVVVAGPIFVIVLLSVMLMMGGDGSSMILTGYLLVLLLIPMAQLVFSFTIDYVTPEV